MIHELGLVITLSKAWNDLKLSFKDTPGYLKHESLK